MISEPGLVPKFAVTNYEASRRFWRDFVGPCLRYKRPEGGLGYLVLSNVHPMFDQINHGRTWVTGSFEPPFGRGINLEVQAGDLDAAWRRLTQAQWPVFVGPEEQWCRAGECEIGTRQFLVQDSDGYLVRLQQEIGEWRVPETQGGK